MRFYLMPKVLAGKTPDYLHPKYIDQFSAEGGRIDYGPNLDVFLVFGDAIDHAALVANSDVESFPENLNGTVSGNVATAEAALEAFGIPGQWITSGMTWRQVLKGVMLIFLLAQRFAGQNNFETLFENVNLDMQWSDIPAQKRQKLNSLADSFNLDKSGLSGTSTLRQILWSLASQNFLALKMGNEDF